MQVNNPFYLGHRFFKVSASLLTALSLLLWLPSAVAATNYNDTDPASTPCGNGTHTVKTWGSFYVNALGLHMAKLDIRRSPYCDTVWIRATNVSGSGSGFGSEVSITADENVKVYYCPNTNCLQDGGWNFGDVLPHTGDAGWSNQFQLPSPGTINGASQPPTVRGMVTIHIGSATYSLDTQMEPIWVHSFSDIDKSNHNGGPSDPVLSCNNTAAMNCYSWGELNGGSVNLIYYLDPSLDTVETDGISIKGDLELINLPAWDDLSADSPNISFCVNPNGCNYGVKVFVGSAQEMITSDGKVILGSFTPDNVSNTIPGKLIYGTLRINDPARYADAPPWSHSCGASDDGCSAPGWDDRILLAHELGHSLGFGHCGLDLGLMCHTTLGGEGTSYWHPKDREKLGIVEIYP